MILIAAYKSQTYGRFAYNLAYSIKDKTDVPICLLTDGNTKIDTSIFDQVMIIDTPEDPCLFKINLNKYTPYDETLYLDADMLCLNDISKFISEVKKYDIWVDTLRDNESFWLKSDSFKNDYQDTNTSIFYFNKKSDWYFDELNKKYKKADKSKYKELWGKQRFIPDESLHSLVLSENKLYFKHERPVYYCDHSMPRQMILKHYFMSMYGARIAKYESKSIYDSIMFSVMKRAGRSHNYKIDQIYRGKFIGL